MVWKWTKEVGFIIGAVSTIEDYYYVSLTPETYKVQYWSCVGDVNQLTMKMNIVLKKCFQRH